MAGWKYQTPRASTLGVFVCGLLWALTALGDCSPPGALTQARLGSVIDGDTLRLSDGTRVRLLGVDTPEIGRQGEAHQPLALAAKQAVERFLADGKLGWFSGEQDRDRYGRRLAHIYNSRGESLEAWLVGQGLAFQSAFPPNLALADCLFRQERQARSAERGIWSEPYWKPRPAAQLTEADTGFRRVQGRITKVDVGRDIWLELDGPLVLRIAEADKVHFANIEWAALKGKTLEVQGWVADRSNSSAARRGFKPFMMAVRTPYAWSLR